MITAPQILVTDDSRTSRVMTLAMIRHRYPDAIIAEAQDGLSAIEMIRQSQPNLAIFDVNMPGISGFEAAEIVKTEFPAVTIAMLTANIQEAMRLKAEQLGVHFFKKPITPVVIGQILDLLVEQQ